MLPLKKRNSALVRVLVTFAGLALCVNSSPGRAPAVSSGCLPLFFQPAQNGCGFLASGTHAQVMIKAAEADILIARPAAGSQAEGSLRTGVSVSKPSEVRVVRMQLLGADPAAELEGVSPLTGKIHYLRGSQASEWKRNTAAWSQVRAKGVYRGIDVLYYGNEQRLEYDFQVAPGASPSDIRLRFKGAESMEVDSQGDLVLRIGGAEIRQEAAILYQWIDGVRAQVKGSYRIYGKDTAGFEITDYRRDLPLVIDPVLTYSTYFGGNSGDISMAVRSGPDQSIYITGQTLSKQFLFNSPEGAFQPSFRGGSLNGDAFVARFDASGSNLIYFTYLGGRSDDGAFDLAVDAQGNAYVTGFTASDNFPVLNALMPKIRGGKDPVLGTYSKDAFISVLNASGSDLIYSTYWGGSAADVATAIAVDSTGAATITGTTVSTNIPVLNPIPGKHRFSGGKDAFVSKFSPDGTSCVFSTYLGGKRADSGQGIATDSEGAIHLTGYTTSLNFPVTNAFQIRQGGTTNSTGASDAFVAKLSPSGTLLYSSFLGGTGTDTGYRIAVDAANAAYVTGSTVSKVFPGMLTNVPGITNARSVSYANTDGFISKVITDGSGAAELAYSVVFGGSLSDVAWDIAASPAGDVHAIGITSSVNFPTNNAINSLSRTNSGGLEVFVFALNASATSVIYSGYLGGTGNDYGYGIALRPSGEALLTGRTVSRNFPRVAPLQDTRYGGNDAFLSILAPDP